MNEPEEMGAVVQDEQGSYWTKVFDAKGKPYWVTGDEEGSRWTSFQGTRAVRVVKPELPWYLEECT